jgi:hypothetical protein
VSDEQRAGRRSGPLILRYRESESTLSSSDVNALIDAIEAWRHAERKRLTQIQRDTPQTVEAATRRIGRLEQLEELLAEASSHSSDPPLELNTDQANLIMKTLDELTGHQRGEITDGLSELKFALYYGV